MVVRRSWVVPSGTVSHPPQCLEASTIESCVFVIGHTHRYNLQSYRIKPHGQLVSVSYMHCCSSTSDLSTSWSRTTLQGAPGPGMPNLQKSFPLRCLQRLSRPHLATRRCHWHDNRYTR